MIRIREGLVEDAEAMAAVNAAGWREGYRDIVPAERLEHLPVASWRRQMAAGLAHPRGHSFTRIAELDGGFAGYCFVAAPGREEDEDSNLAELVALYVDPGLWQRGVGTALGEAVIAETERLGYKEIFLWTFEQNRPALSLYRKLGFEPDGERRPFVPIGTPTIRLRRPLP